MIKICVWEYEENEDYYETSCGEAWCFTEGNCKENKCRYCPYCGKKIKEKQLSVSPTLKE